MGAKIGRGMGLEVPLRLLIPPERLLQQQLHVVVLDAHRGVFLAPAGEDLQRLVQAVGGRHLVPPGPHLHGADDDLQLHALVHLGVPREVVGSPSPGGARRNSRAFSLFP